MFLLSMKGKSHSNVNIVAKVFQKNITWINMMLQCMKEKNHSNIIFVAKVILLSVIWKSMQLQSMKERSFEQKDDLFRGPNTRLENLIAVDLFKHFQIKKMLELSETSEPRNGQLIIWKIQLWTEVATTPTFNETLPQFLLTPLFHIYSMTRKFPS